MPIFEFYITVFNKANGPNGELRHDEGDIINIQPAGAEIGRKELDYFFIIPVYINTKLTITELKRKLCIPLYEDGLIEGLDWREIDYEQDGVDSVLSPDKYVWRLGPVQGIISRPKRIAKNRYRIPIDKLSFAELDLVKLQDTTCLYQPFLAESRIANLPCFQNADSDYEIRQDGIAYKVKQVTKNTRNVYQETIGGKVIRYIRRNEPPQKAWLPMEKEFELFNETPSIAKDEEYQVKLGPNAELIQDKFDDSFLKVKDIG